ncbi:flagellin [Maritimibacter sp. UBA3975]|uniref:flagellin n=1 Tax=Maritimibacter sp. UBA3975 TaxID=1946833 RepID=UPI000C0B946D|nr:flagellin [Maritimibacter sp. UBA3975]MAM61867.1 hypothetical protein [Maritimibacter sp.]|tara:strand:+ start:16014 stop:17024 length:1011 start_codon:yes stop_codon:yes gene_type:complete
MSNLSIGDLANTFQLRRFTTESKTNLARLAKELTTGVKADLGAAVAGDFGPFAGIERSLRANEAYKTANTEASSLFAGAQVALESVQSITRDLSPALLTAASARDRTLVQTTAEDASQKFASVVSRFNTRIADRTIFSGSATDTTPLASADDIMAGISTAVTGLTTVDDIETAVNAWFDDVGGGFETIGYGGSSTDMGPMIVADGETVEMTVRADDPVVRDTLKGFALAALVAEGTLDGDVGAQAELLDRAAMRLVAADGDVTRLRAAVGAAEQRVENAQARNAAQASAYELARGELVNADPYETATMLETVYAQIETLYTVTSRLSALRFSDYMR